MFKWVCLALAGLAVLLFGWMINDLRIELQRSAQMVNDQLPQILANTQTSTETLARLSEDLRQLRDLAGVTDQTRDRSLVMYADGVLDLLENTDAQIGLKKKVFGSGLKDVVPVEEWVVGARKEALWLTFSAQSKPELLEKLCKNKFGSQWHVQFDDAEPVPLELWLREHHPDSRALDAES